MSSDRNGHKTRYSDSSMFDEICELCGATDGWGDDGLNGPCPKREVVVGERDAFEQALKEDWNDVLNHRAFADWLEEHGEDDLAGVHRAWTLKKQREVEEFMEEYADMLSGSDDADAIEDFDDSRYRKRTKEEVLEYAIDCVREGGDARELCLGFDTPGGVFERREEFWMHFTVLTGIPVAEGYDQVFVRCAC